MTEPFLTVISLFLVKGEIHRLIGFLIPFVLDFMKITEPLTCLSRRRGTQSFVVFEFPSTHCIFESLSIFPLNKLGNGVEGENGFAFGCLENGSEQGTQESSQHQTWPLRMKQIHQKSLDMRAIMILIRHNHDASITEFCDTLVLFSLLQAQNLLNRRKFLIRIELLNGDVTDIEKFTTKREDAPQFASHFFQT